MHPTKVFLIVALSGYAVLALWPAVEIYRRHADNHCITVPGGKGVNGGGDGGSATVCGPGVVRGERGHDGGPGGGGAGSYMTIDGGNGISGGGGGGESVAAVSRYEDLGSCSNKHGGGWGPVTREACLADPENTFFQMNKAVLVTQKCKPLDDRTLLCTWITEGAPHDADR